MAKGHEPSKSQNADKCSTNHRVSRHQGHICMFQVLQWGRVLVVCAYSVSWCCGTPPRPGCSPSVARSQLWEGGGVCSGPVVPGFSLESSPVQSRTRSFRVAVAALVARLAVSKALLMGTCGKLNIYWLPCIRQCCRCRYETLVFSFSPWNKFRFHLSQFRLFAVKRAAAEFMIRAGPSASCWHLLFIINCSFVLQRKQKSLDGCLNASVSD